MDIVRGSIVKSRAGRDKGEFLAVIEVEGLCAFVCDGKSRTLESPKKKNLKHLCATRTVVEMPRTNKQLRKLLSSFGRID